MAIQKKSSRVAKKKRILENLTEEFNANNTLNLSFLAGFKSEVHLSVCSDDNEETRK